MGVSGIWPIYGAMLALLACGSNNDLAPIVDELRGDVVRRPPETLTTRPHSGIGEPDPAEVMT